MEEMMKNSQEHAYVVLDEQSMKLIGF